MKRCSGCQQDKESDEFYINNSHKDGLSHICKKCQNEYVKGHYRKNKQQYLDKNKRRKNEARDYVIQSKKDGSCNVCGESRWWVLDFHHIDNKTDDVSRMLNMGLKKIKIEINKCILLCANCHRDLHYKEKCAHSINE